LRRALRSAIIFLKTPALPEGAEQISLGQSDAARAASDAPGGKSTNTKALKGRNKRSASPVSPFQGWYVHVLRTWGDVRGSAVGGLASPDIPLTFSFADALDQELQISLLPLPSPLAVAYRVGEPAPQGGRFVAIWRRALAVGQPLPKMPLPLTVHTNVSVDLEDTYQRATADAYLT
jgi:hypothetical protein